MDAYTARQLARFADIVDQMKEATSNESFINSPNVRCMMALRDALASRGVPLTAVTTVVANAEIELTEFDAEHPDWKRIVNGHADIIARANAFFTLQFGDATPFISKYTFKVKL